MGTFYPVRTKHKLIQNPVCVEETNRCSELGGRAFFFSSSDFISYRDPSVVGWAVVERLAVGKVGRRDPISIRMYVCTRACKSLEQE